MTDATTTEKYISANHLATLLLASGFTEMTVEHYQSLVRTHWETYHSPPDPVDCIKTEGHFFVPECPYLTEQSPIGQHSFVINGRRLDYHPQEKDVL